MSKFKHRNCLYWFEFAPIIKRAERASSSLRFSAPNRSLKITTIIDGQLPSRKGKVATGHDETDHLRDSIICNAGWVDGCIPIRTIPGRVWKDPLTLEERTQMPVRGVRDVLAILLNDGCIRKTEEVELLLK